ncbi:MAG: D-tagatose-bisphosphate aldolase, class II, non-catalytic subunit [Gammaproteobacteria bacterium]|nr:D-tagatose-bisphosphate aldolase, class II, non-catalytic subunit [Gammaproteobacteria bacterium]
MKSLVELIVRHKAGQQVGICSVCSAHPLVIEAALRRAQRGGGQALIEATSNQVNQDGGYTGLRPADFARFVHGIAARVGLPAARVLLGGDHLGPNCWQHLPAAEAMARSEQLLADYVAAGFRKLHLDCSMSCADDPAVLGDAVVAARAARLCLVAEQAWRRAGGEAPVYIVGTEVPVPGGALESLVGLQPTAPQAAASSIDTHQRAFAAAGLGQAWPRVVGLVVQPGVEFDHYKVIDFRPGSIAGLSAVIAAQPGMVYEAHSTDYQTAANLAALVRAHFAILKVGPGLTFALREALWALALIESELLPAGRASNLRATMLAAMKAEPRHWKKYYASTGAQLLLDQQYSLSDRLRYYWPVASVERALAQLLANLEADPPPLSLVSQYLPRAHTAIRNGELAMHPRDWALHHVDGVLQQYGAACGAGA